jgi:hypothetical protein
VTQRSAAAPLAFALVCGTALADDAPIAVAPLPLAAKRIQASAEECAVWRREQSFARSVERHDARAFAEHLHPGTIFDAGHAEADRGRDAVAASWAPIVAGSTIALRWRPGIVQIGGEPGVAISRGPVHPAALAGRRRDLPRRLLPDGVAARRARRRLARPLRRQRVDGAGDGESRRRRALGRRAGDVGLRAVAQASRQAWIAPPLKAPRSVAPADE